MLFGADCETDATFATVVGGAIANQDAATAQLFDEGLGSRFCRSDAGEDEVAGHLALGPSARVDGVSGERVPLAHHLASGL